MQVLLMAVDGHLANTIERALPGAAVLRAAPGVVLPLATLPAVDVVIVGAEQGEAALMEQLRVIDESSAPVGTLVAANLTEHALLEAMRAGARDVIAPDAAAADVVAAVEAALARVRRVAPHAPVPATVTGPRVITVASPKGGCGKTTVAVNLACALAREGTQRVALVDLDIQFGDVAPMLRVNPTFSIADAAQRTAAQAGAHTYLATSDSGVYALCAPHDPEQVLDVRADAVDRIIGELAGIFSYVVIDTVAGLDDLVIAALQNSTDVVLVTGNDVASVRATRRELEVFDRIGLHGARLHLAIGRSDPDGLPAAAIEKACDRPVAVVIPLDHTVTHAQLEGSLIVRTAPNSPAGRAILELATSLGAPPIARRAKRHFGLRRHAS